MNILIIGNGFDIAHGMPTKYGDFLNFIRRYVEFRNSNEVSIQNEEAFEDIIKLKIKNPELYEEIDVLTNDNVWYRHFNSIYENRMIDGKDGWIDFESEISSIVKIIDGFRIEIIEQMKLGNGS